MCCIFGFIRWTIGCIHRTLTFALGFWVVLMIIYACGFAIAAGVAYGYDYCMAEYATLARDDVHLEMQDRTYSPDILIKRHNNYALISRLGEEFKQKPYKGNAKYSLKNEQMRTQPTWAYSPTTKRGNGVPPYQIVKSARRTTTEILGPEMIEIINTEEKTSLKPTLSTRGRGPSRSAPLRTFTPPDHLKWRPTRPYNFFYKTPGAPEERKAMENVHSPDMEIRMFNEPWYGKNEGSVMRHWGASATTKPTEPDESQEEDVKRIYF